MQSYTDWLASTDQGIDLSARLDTGTPRIEFDREATLFEDEVGPTDAKGCLAQMLAATPGPTEPSPQPTKKPGRRTKKQAPPQHVEAEAEWESDDGATDDELDGFLRAHGRTARAVPDDEWAAFGLRYRTDDFRPSHGGTFPTPETGARIPPAFVESAEEVANRETKAAFWAAAASGRWRAASKSLRRLTPRVLAFPLSATYKPGRRSGAIMNRADGQLRARLAAFAAAHGYTLALAELHYFRFTLAADAHEAWRFPKGTYPVPGTRAKLALARRVRAEDGRHRVLCAGDWEGEMVLTDASMMREPPGKEPRARELHKPAAAPRAQVVVKAKPKHKATPKAKPELLGAPPPRPRLEFPYNECLEGLRARYVHEHEYRRTAILLWKRADHGAVILEHMGAGTVMRNIEAGIAHARAGGDLQLPAGAINEALDMSLAPAELWRRIHAKKDGQRLLREAVLEWTRVSQAPEIAAELEALWTGTPEYESSEEGENFEEDVVAQMLEDERNDPVFQSFGEGVVGKILEEELNDPLFHAALYEGMRE